MSLVENFDSYNDGDLNGQGSWSGAVNFDVQGVTVQAGTKAVKSVPVDGVTRINKTFAAATTGSQIWYMRVSNPTDGRGTYMELKAGIMTPAFVEMTNADRILNFRYYSGGGNVNVEVLAGYTADTWYKMEIEWNATTNQVRFRLNDGSWFGWYTCDDFGDIDNLNLTAANLTQIGYWDSFSEASAVVTSNQNNLSLLGVG